MVRMLASFCDLSHIRLCSSAMMAGPEPVIMRQSAIITPPGHLHCRARGQHDSLSIDH